MLSRIPVAFVAGITVGAVAGIMIGRGLRPDAPPPVTETPADSSVNVALDTRVEAWLDAYRTALEAKDVETIAQMIGLAEDKRAALDGALRNQKDLVVTFSDLSIDVDDPDSAVARYMRSDSFTAPNGRRVRLQQRLAQTFRVQEDILLAETPSPVLVSRR